MERYLDFDLEFSRAEGAGYSVRFVQEPAGRVVRRFEFSAEEHPLDDVIAGLEEARDFVRKPPAEVRERRVDVAEKVENFGRNLFEAAFPPEIREQLNERLQAVAQKEATGLRVRLRFDGVPELEALPWEYLWQVEGQRFLGLSESTPIVRYFDFGRENRPKPMTETLNILVMVADPSDVPSLNVEQEWRNLQDALSGLMADGRVAITRLPEATLSVLQSELRRGEYHVFHFIGHGGIENGRGVLVLENENGRAHLVESDFVGTLLHDEKSLRLAVLNSCDGARQSTEKRFAGMAQTLVRQGVPAVVAMQFKISDPAAITFGRELYAALADMRPISAAVSEGRKAIFVSGNRIEWGTPVLFMRTDDGRLIVLEKPQPRLVRAVRQSRRQIVATVGRVGAIILLVLVGLLGVIGVVAAQPCQLEGEVFNVAVGRFDTIGTARRQGLISSQRLAVELDTRLETGARNRTDAVCLYRRPIVKTDVSAEKLANRYGADMVIFGTVLEDQVAPRFYNAIDLYSDADELTGLHELPYNNDSSDWLDATVAFVRALDRMNGGTDTGYFNALLLFEAALDNAGDSHEAIAVIKLFMAKAERELGDLEAARMLLCDAISADLRAQEIAEDEIESQTCLEQTEQSQYGRAIIGLGNVEYARGQALLIEEGWTLATQDAFLEAFRFYSAAGELKRQPPGAYIAEKSAVGRGRVLAMRFLRDEISEPAIVEQAGEVALALFDEVIGAFDSAERANEQDNPYFRELTAMALGFSGSVRHRQVEAQDEVTVGELRAVCDLFTRSLDLSDTMVSDIGDVQVEFQKLGLCNE